jgi:hypothetical protein
MRLTCNKHYPVSGGAGTALQEGESLSARWAQQQQQTAENGDRGKGCEGTGQAAHGTTIAGFAALRNGSRAGEDSPGKPALKQVISCGGA